MAEAAAEEAQIALDNGSVAKDGLPLVRVVCDGSWAKRSYKSNYNSSSGVGAIVGYNTRKVLYIGVKNKYCLVCTRSYNANQDPKEHECFKNWTGSSSSMEAAALVEGFKQSEDMYGIRYHEMIADGDSSCYNKILESRPYKDLTVQKIECRNHLLRNLCNKLREISNSGKFGPLSLRKNLATNILKCRVAVSKATQYRRSENCDSTTKIKSLKGDIINIPSHVFGEHKDCGKINYFCKKSEPDETNFVSEFRKYGMYDNILDIFRYLAQHSKSLIRDVDSNYVEQFHNIVCKFIGGKRINYALRRSYQSRCSAAVVSANTKKPFSRVHKHVAGYSPGKYAKDNECKKFQYHQKRNYIPAKRRLNYSKPIGSTSDPDYGSGCQKQDMVPEEYDNAKHLFVSSITRTREEREDVEERTRAQADSIEWFEERRKLLTASNFGSVCRRLPHTNCKTLVKQILYYIHVKSKATFWGQVKEKSAKEALQVQCKINIKECGLIIDPVIPYLGATPDGLIGMDGILEIKCPYSARSMTPEDGIKNKKILFWKLDTDKSYTINMKHHWYYQIQGQLHVTRRNFCIFAVWTPLGMKWERVIRDDLFWEEKMEAKLKLFYEECLLPELVDPRHPRNMEIREPKYILDEQQKRRFLSK